jgi:hemerythrin-like domain-containing protein
MLAAQCVCGILQAEHSVIRQSVSQLADLTRGSRWREPGSELRQLQAQVQHLRVFDRLYHGTKDRHLWQPLWGRSDEADLLLGSLEYTHERNADLLWRSLTLLHAVEQGESQYVADVLLTLRRHRLGMLKQMDIEEHDLMRLARHLLHEDEWAAIASQISSVPCPPDTAFPFSPDEDDGALMHRAADEQAQGRMPGDTGWSHSSFGTQRLHPLEPTPHRTVREWFSK